MKDGSFPSLNNLSFRMGPTSLATLALLHAGEDPTGPTIQSALAALRKSERKLGESGRLTYPVSVLIMVLAEYGRAIGAPKGEFCLSKEDLHWLKNLTRWLVRKRAAPGVWHYPQGGVYDHSNTQYALLALKEARRVGVRVGPAVFADSLRHFLRVQQKDGPEVPRYRESSGKGGISRSRSRVPGSDRARGWGYRGRSAPSGAMTAAGVAAVAICSGEIPGDSTKRLREKGMTSMRDGLAWLGKHFEVTSNPKAGSAWHYYYLYGLERAGALAGVVHMGNHRWYAEGAKYLVASQSPDGAWRTPRSRMPGVNKVDVIDSSFALLFLARATRRSLGVVTERNLLNLTEADKLSDADLGEVFGLAFDELGTLDGEALVDRATDFAFFGPRVIPLLIQRLAAADETIRTRAILVLKAITGKSHEYDPSGPSSDRAAAIGRSWRLTAPRS